jgi:hypothetical protein
MNIQLPEKIKNDALFTHLIQSIITEEGKLWKGPLQKIIDDAQYTIDDIKKKWWGSIDAPDTEAMKLVIAELGYQYILDVLLSPPDANITNVFIYITLIHYLKGSKKGLELVLVLLDINYTILEWWEDVEGTEPFTFKLSIFPKAGIEVNTDALRTFCKNYVYPIMFSETVVDGYPNLLHAGVGFVDTEVSGAGGLTSTCSFVAQGFIDTIFYGETIEESGV